MQKHDRNPFEDGDGKGFVDISNLVNDVQNVDIGDAVVAGFPECTIAIRATWADAVADTLASIAIRLSERTRLPRKTKKAMSKLWRGRVVTRRDWKRIHRLTFERCDT